MNGGRQLEVTAQALNDAGSGMTQVVSQLDQAMTQLRASIAEHGSPWGADELGAQFGQAYTDAVTQVFTAVSSYVGQVDYAATNLPVSAGMISDTEAANTRLMQMWRTPDGGQGNP